MEYYVYLKALHIIFMVAWFAALFYMPRLLIYHVEAQDKDEPARSILSDQFKIMQRRLWNIIAWPAMTLTWFFGLWMLFLNLDLLTQAWFILKLICVFALSLFHLQTHFIARQQQNNTFKWSSFKLRLWNEAATILLFVIVFLVVPKQNSGWVWAVLGCILLGIAIYTAVILYKRNREKKDDDSANTNDTNAPPLPPMPPPVN
jgi:protoporphyrinogen IX oxidase